MGPRKREATPTCACQAFLQWDIKLFRSLPCTFLASACLEQASDFSVRGAWPCLADAAPGLAAAVVTVFVIVVFVVAAFMRLSSTAWAEHLTAPERARGLKQTKPTKVASRVWRSLYFSCLKVAFPRMPNLICGRNGDFLLAVIMASQASRHGAGDGVTVRLGACYARAPIPLLEFCGLTSFVGRA